MKALGLKYIIFIVLLSICTNAKTIKIVYNHSTPPLKFTDINGDANGLLIDIWKLWAKKNSIKIEFIEASWDDTLKMIQDGRADIHAGLYYTQNRDIILDYSKYSLFQNKSYFFYNKDIVDIHKKEDMEPFVIGIGNGYSSPFMREKYPNFAIKKFLNDDTLHNAFANNKINIALSSMPAMVYFIQKNNYSLKNYKYSDATYAYTKDYFGAVKKGNTKLLKRIDNGFGNISKKEIMDIETQWTIGLNKHYLKDYHYKKISLSQKHKEYFLRKKEIKMCVDPHWMPFESIKNGKHIGIIADIFKELQKSVPIPITLVTTDTWNNSLLLIQNRKCDILAGAVHEPSRDAYLNFTRSYLTFPEVIVTRENEPFIDDFETVIHKKIGIVKNSAITALIKNKYPSINLINVDTISDGLMKVNNGELYGFLNTSATLSYYISQEGMSNLKIASKVGIDYHLRTAVRSDDLVLLDIMNALINNLSENTINSIKKHWLKVKVQEIIDYSIIYKTIFVFILILLVVLYWNRKLDDEIKEKEKIQNELKIAQNNAINANVAKSEFLAKMSHEIRTPMNAVLGMLYLLQQTKISSVQNNYITKATYAAKSLLGVINDILDFSKIEAGKLDIDNKEFELNAMIMELLSVMSFKAEEKNIKLFLHTDNLIPKNIISDKLRVGQILNNLISNALKFTNNGKVIISTKLLTENEKSLEIMFSIKDEGIGIDKDSQEKLFQEFSQVDNSSTRDFEGTGLGLAISKKLTELLGGKIWIEDSKEGMGSTFCFIIKCEKSTSLENVAYTKMQITPDTFLKKSEDEEQKIFFNGDKILLVEDNELNQEFAFNILHERGLDVDIANNGIEAIAKVKEKKYDLILMDIQMPLMDGIEATKNIRKMETNDLKNIPIIALSANALVGDKEKNLKSGMNEHITKPINPLELFTILSRYLITNLTSSSVDKSLTMQKLDSSVFDVENTLSKLNHNEGVYIKILKQFSCKYENILKEISNIIKEKDRNLLGIKLHEIKGVCGNIGAKKLFDKLLEIENYLMNNTMPNLQLLDEFKEEFEKVIQSINQIEIKNIKSKSFDKKEVKTLLLILENNLEEDIVKCDEILQKLKPYLQDRYEQFSNMLSMSISEFDTDKAKEFIHKFIKEIE